MAVVDGDRTKLAKLLTMHPKAHAVVRIERIVAYEMVIEACQAGLPIADLIAWLRQLEPKGEDD